MHLAGREFGTFSAHLYIRPSAALELSWSKGMLSPASCFQNSFWETHKVQGERLGLQGQGSFLLLPPSPEPSLLQAEDGR